MLTSVRTVAKFRVNICTFKRNITYSLKQSAIMENPSQSNQGGTEIVGEPADIQIRQDPKGGFDVKVENKWGWPSWLSWRPTSSSLLRDVETKMLEASGITFKQTTVKAGDHEINTIIAGQGPPLVLLHGFGAGVGFWVYNLPQLAEHRTVYAIDLPGFGRSSRIPYKGKTTEEAEEWFLKAIEEWRKNAGIQEPFTLLGHSFGGYLAGSYALKHPDNISHLILADPWGIPPRDPEWEGRLPLKWRIARSVITSVNPLSIIRVAGPYGPGLISKFRKDIEMKFSSLYTDTSIVSQYIYHINAQNPSGETAFAALNESLGWAARPLATRLPALPNTVSVALLYGSSTWMDKDAGRVLREELGDRATLNIIPRAGHHIYADNYLAFNEVVTEILKSKN